MNFGSGLPFSAVGYKGGANQNGIPVVSQGVAPSTIGGILSTANTAPSGNGFGSVLSRLASAANEFFYGLVTSGIVAGILQFDAGIAQNDPAHSDYPLLGQPVTVGFNGPYVYNRWNKTATGAIDPVPGCVVIFKNDTGEIQFIASGAAPSGWTILVGAFVANKDELGFTGVELWINTTGA